MKNISFIEWVGFFISIFNFAAGFLLWYSASVAKNYAAKRDFQGLKSQYDLLLQQQRQMHIDMDKIGDSLSLDLRDVKGSLNVLLVKILPGSNTQ